MEIYTLNLILIIIMFIYSKFKKSITGNSNIKYGYWIIFLSLFLISGFRVVGTGTDTTLYKLYFETIDLYNYNTTWLDFEIGYYLLNEFVRLITDDYQYIFILAAFVTQYLINKTLKDYSLSYSLSIFLYITLFFYYHSFNILRQYIAISLVFFSIKYIINKDLWKFLCIVLIASLFHRTALIMLPFYWISRWNISNLMYIILTLIAIIFSIATDKIVHLISLVIPKFTFYVNYSQEGASVNSIILIISIVIIFSLIYRKRLILKDKSTTIYINLVYFALFFNILVKGNFVFSRIGEYFYIFILLLIPVCIKILNKYIRVILYLLIIPIMFLYHNYLMSSNNSGVVPYESNFNIIETSSSILLIVLLIFALSSILKKVSWKKI